MDHPTSLLIPSAIQHFLLGLFAVANNSGHLHQPAGHAGHLPLEMLKAN